MDNKAIAFELSKKYAFETFDFKNGTPEELLKLYQDTEHKIYAVLNEQKKSSTNSSLTTWLNNN